MRAAFSGVNISGGAATVLAQVPQLEARKKNF
jgi:hypothetical protein